VIRKKHRKPSNLKHAKVIKKYDCYTVLDWEGYETGWWKTEESAKEHAEILNSFYKEDTKD